MSAHAIEQLNELTRVFARRSRDTATTPYETLNLPMMRPD
jgi:hypothetical protein